MFRYAFLCLFVLYSVSGTPSLSKEENKALTDLVNPVMKKCAEKINKTERQYSRLTMYICGLKETGVIDANGKFDKDLSIDLIKSAVKNDEFIDMSNKLGEICLKVNDEDLCNEQAGDVRALLLIKCLEDNIDMLTY